MTDESATPPAEDAPGVGIDRLHGDAAIYQAFNPGPIEFVRGDDGLPAVKPSPLPIVPPLRPETMVCMGDRSEYVVRDAWGEIVRRYPPERVHRSPAGAYYVKRLFWFRLPVEPLRPQCSHYRRQMTDFQDAAGNQFIERLCTARRDDNSFFLSVRDQQVHACELREPRDFASADRLDRFDDAKMKLGRERYQEGGEFDVDAALKKTEEEADRGIAFGGIFKE